MAQGQAEIAFGIGTIAIDGKPATAVLVNDQVATLRDIVARHSTPGATAPVMRDFLPDWERWHGWLRGLNLDPSRSDFWHPATSVKFMPPVPEPGNIFHTYHNYDRPSSTTGRRDPPKAERVLPDVFLGSRVALTGHGETVFREHGAVQFDFELEVTAVIGKTAYRVSADQAEGYVAGYTIGNDLTTHFGWWKQIRSQTTLNDNIRMKNFPGYTPMGPVIVPSDIVGDPHALRVRASQDGVTAPGCEHQRDDLEGGRADRIFVLDHAAAAGRPDPHRLGRGAAAARRSTARHQARPDGGVRGREAGPAREPHHGAALPPAARGRARRPAGSLARTFGVVTPVGCR